MSKLCQTDWLASRPIFYNEKTCKVSSNINDVIDFNDLEFHPEGFNNYLDYGYSVFEQTPVKNVKFLRHSSCLNQINENQLEVQYLDDISDKWHGVHSDEEEVISKIQLSVNQWESSFDGDIVVPTSGGYDSRLLNFLISDKSRIKTFTYGLSDIQSQSYEVVFAKNIAKSLGLSWEQIELGHFHQYFDQWHQYFGVSTHAHGMYHIEFYTKLFAKIDAQKRLLSGIFGDVWAGNTSYQVLETAQDLIKLGYTHGLNGDSSYSLLRSDFELRDLYWEKNKEKLNDNFYQTLALIRNKMILISYLLRVPEELFGCKVWSPFMNPDIALSMLNLPPHRRENRRWQSDFFRSHSLELESSNLKADFRNTLNHQAMQLNRLTPLKTSLLREVVQPQYVEWVNSKVMPLGRGLDFIRRGKQIPKIASLLRYMGVQDQRLKAYQAYLTLKPVQELLIKRDLFVRTVY